MARAIWKGTIGLGKHTVAVKLYSAIEDQRVQFHMLHRKDHAPVEQHIVRKDTGEDVERADMRKAYSLGQGTAVMLEPDELATLVPPESRAIELTRFIAASALSDQWYDRPNYLGPDRDADDYFALAHALEHKKRVGIARWVMRKKHYLGALYATDGYLLLSTLRRADQVLSFANVEPAKTAAPNANELKLAQQLVDSISEDFDPTQWQNDYRERLHSLIAAKAKGEKIEVHKPRRKAASANLADSLRASIAAAKEKKVA